jgi:hypothetical protein
VRFRGLFSLALLAVVLVTVAPAGAVHSRAAKTYNFRVIMATHSSSSRKDDPPFYNGNSTSKWQLAKATRKAPNKISVSVSNGFALGLGNVNIKGVYTAQASTNQSKGNCQLTAPTGSKDYAAVAPGPFTLAVAQDSKSKRRAAVALGEGLGFGNASYASIDNPYFGSECSTSSTGEPDANTTHLISVPKTVFARPVVTLRFVGATNSGGIVYSWSTTIKLKRIVKKHK